MPARRSGSPGDLNRSMTSRASDNSVARSRPVRDTEASRSLRAPRMAYRNLPRVAAVIALGCTGCGPSSKPDLVSGKRGVLDGDMVRPRAAVIDHDDRLWIVDFTARVQAYDLDGNYIGPTFTTPDFRNGRPSGLGVTRDGKLIVCDSHYHCARIYEPDSPHIKKMR